MSMYTTFAEAIRNRFGYDIEALPSASNDIRYGVFRMYSPLYSEKRQQPLTLTVSTKESEKYLRLSSAGYFNIDEEEVDLMLRTCAVLNVNVVPVDFIYNPPENSIEIKMNVSLSDLELSGKLCCDMLIHVSQACDAMYGVFEETRNRKSLMSAQDMQRCIAEGLMNLSRSIEAMARDRADELSDEAKAALEEVSAINRRETTRTQEEAREESGKEQGADDVDPEQDADESFADFLNALKSIAGTHH